MNCRSLFRLIYRRYLRFSVQKMPVKDCMVPMDDEMGSEFGKERRSMWKDCRGGPYPLRCPYPSLGGVVLCLINGFVGLPRKLFWWWNVDASATRKGSRFAPT